MMYVKLKEPVCSAIMVNHSEQEDIWDYITWLGDDFIAMTCGNKVSVPTVDGEVTISARPEMLQGLAPEEKFMLIVRDNIRNTIVVVGVGQYLVRTGRGYEVYNDIDSLLNNYEIIKDPDQFLP